MIENGIKYSYKDIMIKPAVLSNISDRDMCDPFKVFIKLPIFTAPMSSVVCEENFNLFEKNYITPILPRNFSLDKRIEYLRNYKWVALSLTEFNQLFNENDWDFTAYDTAHISIDIANGHMKDLCKAVSNAISKYPNQPNFKIMVGNIANPETYRKLAFCGVHYIRIGIGEGNGCITSSCTGVHYPMASLIEETYKVKQEILNAYINDPQLDHTPDRFEVDEYEDSLPKIVADGGVCGNDDIIKAYALGADYVMVGSVFAQLIESAAETTTPEYKIINPFKDEIIKQPNGAFKVTGVGLFSKLYKRFYGMASRQGQIDISGEKTHTSEGCEKILPCTTTIHKWVENFISNMRTAMSYTNCYHINDFNPMNVTTIIISEQAKQSINK